MSIFSAIRRHHFIASSVAIFVVIVGIITGRMVSNKTPEANDTGTRKITLTPASNFREGNLTVSADGVVEAHAQAELKSQVSAPVSRINADIGSNVYAGQIILELENSDTRASLEQAKASLALAQGQQLTGNVSFDSAKQSLIDKINDAYTKGYDIFNSQISPFLQNNNITGGNINSYGADYALTSRVLSTRIDLENNFITWKTAVDKLSSSSSFDEVKSAADVSQKNLALISQILSDISKVLNDAAQSTSASSFITTVNNWKALVTNTNSTISGLTQALNGAQSAFTNSNVAQSSTVVAQIKLAQAGVDNLQAQLAKTIIRSPISGKVASLPLREGELASPGTLLATVVGEGGLEIKSYISGDDLPYVKTGASVAIQGNTTGTVTNVAPSLNSLNKKVQVDINVNNPSQSGLIVGQNISVAIKASNTDVSSSTAQSAKYIVPIQDIKIVPGNAFVYTIDSDSKIKENEVILGDIHGDFIEVTSGLSDDMNIVTPVYELDPGQKVIVQ